jgi:hypothetical protein
MFLRIYKEDMQLFDVEVQEHWAVLIGYDAHRIVYHSVYKGFISQFEG